MKVFITITLIAVLGFSVCAQFPPFAKTYGFGLELEGLLNVIVENDGYIVCGVTTAQEFGGGQAIKLMKLDFNSNILWHKNTGEYVKFYWAGASGSLRKTSDESYILGGSIVDTLGNSDALLVKFTQEGDTVFTRIFGGNEFDIGYSSTETSDGGYALFGETLSYGDIDGDWYLVKTDSLGNFQWQKTYGENLEDRGGEVYLLPDGGFLLGGAATLFNNLWQAHLIKIDSAGNEKWSKTYGGNFESCGPNINPTKDGGFIFSTCTDSILSGTDPTYAIFKIDSIGNLEWKKYFQSNRFHDIIMVREVSSGGYVFCGRYDDEVLHGIIGWIVRLDSVGNILWERRYSHKNEFFSYDLAPAEFWDIQPTPDGGFIAVGKTFNDTQDFWVVKLDSLGCIDGYCGLTDTNCYYLPPCIEEDTVSVVEVEDVEKVMSVYPNPASETLHISLLTTRYALRTITITDISGKKIKETNEWVIPVSDIPKGFYLVTVQLTNGESQTAKVIIE